MNQDTLQHTRYPDIYGMGDACSAQNAKTAAAVRKQAPVVAENLLSTMDGKTPTALYDGEFVMTLVFVMYMESMGFVSQR